jgi:hypothetical protein
LKVQASRQREGKKREDERFSRMSTGEHLGALKALLENRTVVAAVIDQARQHATAIPIGAAEKAEAENLLAEAQSRLEVLARKEAEKKAADAKIMVANARGQIAAGNYISAFNLLEQARSSAPRSPTEQQALEIQSKIRPKRDKQIEIKDHPQGTLAGIVCKEYVKEHLKAPSTADFQSFWERDVQDLGNWRYRVSSHVDAQNSFGAQIRTTFTCEVQCTAVEKCSVTRFASAP